MGSILKINCPDSNLRNDRDSARYAADMINNEIEKSNYLDNAPFEDISVFLKYGESNKSDPHYFPL